MVTLVIVLNMLLSVKLARSAIKAFSFLSVGNDKIAEWTAKAELRILHIE